MINDLINIGDKVIVTIEKDAREWGYNPCPDGTKAKVISFAEIDYGRLQTFGKKPGVYVNRSWVKICLEMGKEYLEWSGRLELSSQKEYKKRLAAFRRLQKENPDGWRKDEFIRDLPETPFWEGDIVRVEEGIGSGWNDREDPTIFQITGIEYNCLGQRTDNGSEWPAYRVSDTISAGWHVSIRADQMKLIERGPVWKHYHNEPIQFESLAEEAQFFSRLGHTDEVRNPKTGLYRWWTKDEVLEAIREGIAHGFSMSNGLFGMEPSPYAITFRNEELGKRVAQATLEGFKDDAL